LGALEDVVARRNTAELAALAIEAAFIAMLLRSLP
jgi:hypothetical protein